MYYIIVCGNVYERQLIKPLQEQLQNLANQFEDDVYVIEGEYTGQHARPNKRPSAAQRAELSIVSDNALL